MPPRKRARGAYAPAAAAPRVTIKGEIITGHHWLAKLSVFRQQGTHTDVTVCTNGKDFAAHRAVLAACSDYLAALFAAGMRDSQSQVVSVDDVPAHIFEAILSFVYDGSCDVEESALTAVLEASARLQILALQEAALQAVLPRLNAETALQFWTTGDQLTLPALVEAASKVAVTSFEALAASGALLHASHAQWRTLLCADGLAVRREESVFLAVQRWHEETKPTPSESSLLELLRLVRFGCMASDFFQQSVRPWPPMASAAAKEVLLDAMAPFCVGGTPPKPRRSHTMIEWQVFHSNARLTTYADGKTVFQRSEDIAWDVALGKLPITEGRHEWIIQLPFEDLGDHVHVGVALASCDKREFGSSGDIWTVKVFDFTLNEVLNENPHWQDDGEEVDYDALPGSTVRVLLDMDARTLSFARNGDELKVAYIDLPAELHPCIQSGDTTTVSILSAA